MADGTVKIAVELDSMDFEEKLKGLSKTTETLLGGLPGTATGAVNSADFASAGEAVCEGVSRGIRSGKWRIIDAIEQAAAAAKAAFDSAMQINSPAKAMIPSGKSIPEGIAQGIKAGQSSIDSSLNALSDRIKAARLENPAFFDGAASTIALDRARPLAPNAARFAMPQTESIDYGKLAQTIHDAMPGGSLKIEMDGKALAEANAERNARAINGRTRTLIQGYGG